MKQKIGVINSDEVNRKRMMFPVETLEKGLNQRWFEGNPVNIGHDLHRPLGWGRPLGLYLEPGLSRLVAITYLPENKDDWEKITNARYNFITKIQKEECKPHLAQLESLVSKHKSKTTEFIFTGCASAFEPDIVWKMFPKLFNNRDKDGLNYLKDILINFSYLKEGYFKHNKSNAVICVHPYFRKSLSRLNNFNQEFLERLFSFMDNKDVNIRIAIDSDLIGFAPSFSPSIELEYWRGPKYDDDIESMEVGVSVYATNPDDYEKIFHQIERSEVWFKKTEDTREFELEELKDCSSHDAGKEVFANRYVHSIYHLTSSNFEHFDGAIKIYDEKEKLERFIQDIKSAGKKARYFKIFRMDGKIAINDWKSLVTDFFKGNPLIKEYFKGITEEKYDFKPQMLDLDRKKSPILEKCPYTMDKRMGIRMMLSYFPIRENDDNLEREIEVIDTVTIDEKVFHVIEYDVLELKKALSLLKDDLSIPSDVEKIAFEDMNLNMPLIRHGRKNYPDNILNTFKALNLIFDNLVKRESKHVMVMNLGWLTESKEIRLSIIGNVFDLNEWSKHFSQNVPLKDKDIGIWLKHNREWLTKSFPNLIDTPSLGELINDSGILWINRRIIDKDVPLRFYKDENGDLMYEMGVPNDQIELYEAIKEKTIEPTPAYFIKSSECSKCGEDYFKCPHSKYLEDDVKQNMKEFSLVTYFWSNKKA
jgi:hypothetical protein